ncbi:hypothetical protein COV49_01380 [Candidatus Falkowbacteria bacterium CG11_big_fil_rev_8_21_14_0_20_39_10]|uniref:Capsular biosynthesis protein n=1 Tax=Candidatus Falkowbacteria bacterium CG11_big_fil_rev_8_21_14_0_20_39_10 TaxID=1974570 RepID=A0A2M6K9U5_9BACT|nr:MAG: hypothetical protein COV49_01380 [Candidatus Falkowbacteria bacterium CG11_big_fil_rev_8_21_14_0_20_39_10]
MKIFLIWADYIYGVEYLISELEKRSHEVVYWVGLADGNENKFKGVFHEHYAAWAGSPAKGIDMAEFQPPNKELIKRLYGAESTVLTMFNKRFGHMCVDERKHVYYNMLQYWHGVIKKYKPDVIIFPTLPHTAYNYIIYILAKLLNIEMVMFENSEVSDDMLLYKDWREGNLDLQKRIKENFKKIISIEDLCPSMREYYQKQVNPKIDSTPAYMKYQKKRDSGFGLLKKRFYVAINSIKDGTIFKKVLLFLVKQFKSNLRKDYFKLQIEPNFKKKFVYIPLHYQPERTSIPQGDIFVDQILMIETVAFSLPDDWVIYVKEHPSQWWLKTGINYSSCRYPGYYERIAKLKNVFLVPIFTDTYSLINKSQVVITLTGTACWEALMRSKPAIVFGFPWYRDCPALFRVDSVKSCREALKKIKEGHKVNQQDIIVFLKSLDEVAIKGYFEVAIDKSSKITIEQSKRNIVQAIIEEVEKIKLK